MPPNWQRWPPPQTDSGYVMATPGLVPYDAVQHHHMAPPQPAVSSSYVMEQSYAMTPATNPNYAVHNGYVLDVYTPQSSTSFPPVAKQYSQERQPSDVIPSNGHHGIMTPVSSASPASTAPLTRSPVVKTEPQPFEPIKSKVITANASEGQAQQPVFNTSIDRLMKVIQQKNDTGKTTPPESDQALQTHPTVAHLGAHGHLEGIEGIKIESTVDMDPEDKPHACQRKKCHKRFTQRTHLSVHDRAHTGERPHRCSFAGCGKYFSQKGNLRSHERRHKGEKPFACDWPGCTKRFPQRGNLAAHKETHQKKTKFRCIFCSDKSFSSRGNLKTHQNHYHKEDIEKLTEKFSHVEMSTLSAEDAELWNYFLRIHNNSNKGIKGRGKGCNVGKIEEPVRVETHPRLQSPPEFQHAPFHVSHGLPHSMGFSHFGLQRHNFGHEFLVARDPQAYAMYDMDQASISSGTLTPASSPGGMYHEHQRNMVFHERMY